MKKSNSNKYIKEEIEAINFNLSKIGEKLSSGNLSTAGCLAAEELIKVLGNVKEYLVKHAEKQEEAVTLLISKLPLLYFRIPTLN